MKIMTLIVALAFLALCSPLHAHEDTVLTLSTNRLHGLPEKYEPAGFSYGARTLAIATNAVVIPPAIWKLFGDTDKYRIVFSASLYHDGYASLPAYLYVRNENCRFLVNLKTLKMLDFMRDKKITQEALRNWNVTRPKTHQPEN